MPCVAKCENFSIMLLLYLPCCLLKDLSDALLRHGAALDVPHGPKFLGHGLTLLEPHGSLFLGLQAIKNHLL